MPMIKEEQAEYLSDYRKNGARKQRISVHDLSNIKLLTVIEGSVYSAIRVVRNNELWPLAHEVAFKKRTIAMSAPMLMDGSSCPKTDLNKLSRLN